MVITYIKYAKMYIKLTFLCNISGCSVLNRQFKTWFFGINP